MDTGFTTCVPSVWLLQSNTTLCTWLLELASNLATCEGGWCVILAGVCRWRISGEEWGVRRAGVWIVVTLVTIRLSLRQPTDPGLTNKCPEQGQGQWQGSHNIVWFIQMLRARRNSFSFYHLKVHKREMRMFSIWGFEHFKFVSSVSASRV